jgi:hypothetical protein
LTDLDQIKCHTMPSNFPRKCLKTKESNPDEVSHFFVQPVRTLAAKFGTSRRERMLLEGNEKKISG